MTKMEEFKEKCLEQGDAKRIDGADRKREAERFENQSKYHMKAAEELVQGEASLIAIVEGYYSMLHKANEALARAGFKTGTHKCTLLGLREVFKKSELARELQEAMDERINVDYYTNPEKPHLEEFKEPEEFLNQHAKPFNQKIQEVIEQEELE